MQTGVEQVDIVLTVAGQDLRSAVVEVDGRDFEFLIPERGWAIFDQRAAGSEEERFARSRVLPVVSTTSVEQSDGAVSKPHRQVVRFQRMYCH